MIIEFIKFIIYSALIVIISKYILVVALRKLAEILNLKPKTVGNIAGVAGAIAIGGPGAVGVINNCVFKL